MPACEQLERRLPATVREKLLSASARTLDRLLKSCRRQAGWLEVDTVALSGGSAPVWTVDGVDYTTTWVEVRVM